MSSRAALGPTIDRQLINLSRQDEIIFTQATDGMSPDFDAQVAVAFEVQIGVMSLGFGQGGDLLKKTHPSQEVLAFPVFADALAIGDQSPAGESRELFRSRGG
jgi:hypothetical protein